MPGLPMKDLWALWDAYFPRRPAQTNRHYVESRLAYRLQEKAYGPLPVGVRRLSGGAWRAFLEDQARWARGRECHLIPGTVLEREWDAHEYRVTVTADGRYELNGKRFNSLSAAARHICGVSFSAVIEQINSATSI